MQVGKEFDFNNNVLKSGEKHDPVLVQLFYESLCAPSREFISEIFTPTVLELQSHLVIEMYPYGNANVRFTLYLVLWYHTMFI